VYIVAIDNLGEDREGIARALSGALETTVYDALVRVRVPCSPLRSTWTWQSRSCYDRSVLKSRCREIPIENSK